MPSVNLQQLRKTVENIELDTAKHQQEINYKKLSYFKLSTKHNY